MNNEYKIKIDKIFTLGEIAADATKALIEIIKSIPEAEQEAFNNQLQDDPRTKKMEAYFDAMDMVVNTDHKINNLKSKT